VLIRSDSHSDKSEIELLVVDGVSVGYKSCKFRLDLPMDGAIVD